jgi:hypothetical protein
MQVRTPHSIGEENRTMTTATNSQLTDVSPATPPPDWCLPGAVPSTDSVEADGNQLWHWTRTVSDNVWISCEDKVINGRVMRSQPKIALSDVGMISAEEALEIAEELTLAEQILAGRARDPIKPRDELERTLCHMMDRVKPSDPTPMELAAWVELLQPIHARVIAPPAGDMAIVRIKPYPVAVDLDEEGTTQG